MPRSSYGLAGARSPRTSNHGTTTPARIGVWVRRPDKGDGFEDKIAAIGVRLKRWVSLHGIAINVEPDLTHFDGIVPCGVADPRYDVTSLVDLGLPVAMADLDVALKRRFAEIFERRKLISARPGRIDAS